MLSLGRIFVQQIARLQRESRGLLVLLSLQFCEGQPERVYLDLSSLVENLAAEWRAAYRQHTLMFTSPTNPILLEVDPVYVEQILYHLLQNAVKYSPVDSLIQIQLEQNKTEVRLLVSDQGFGIPAEELPNIFRCFYRGRLARDQQISGLGLGLYVVERLVTLHGGTIRIKSREGAGTVFSVYLPRSLSIN